MDSFPDGYRALVLGSTGGIGAALLDRLQADPRCSRATGLARTTTIALDYAQPESLDRAARSLQADGPFHLILIATGILQTDRVRPEKRLADLDADSMLEVLRTNTVGPALAIARFAPLLDRQRAVLGVLSAKVGSIGDNRLGGWYSYRASKAALNMIIKTAAIELRRAQPQAVVVALHPGTVDTNLSAPFRGAEIGRSKSDSAADLLAVIDTLTPQHSGEFRSYRGDVLPW